MQTIIEAHTTPTEARTRCRLLRSQGIHAWMLHNFDDVTSGAEGLERLRATTTVAWYCVVDGLYTNDKA